MTANPPRLELDPVKASIKFGRLRRALCREAEILKSCHGLPPESGMWLLESTAYQDVAAFLRRYIRGGTACLPEALIEYVSTLFDNPEALSNFWERSDASCPLSRDGFLFAWEKERVWKIERRWLQLYLASMIIRFASILSVPVEISRNLRAHIETTLKERRVFAQRWLVEFEAHYDQPYLDDRLAAELDIYQLRCAFPDIPPSDLVTVSHLPTALVERLESARR